MSATRLVTSLDDVLGRLPSAGDVAVVRDGSDTLIGLCPTAAVRADGPDGFAALRDLRSGWWAGYLAYDLGRAVERVPDLARPHADLPDVHLVRFDTRLRVTPDGGLTVEGDDSMLGQILARDPVELESASLTRWRSSLDRAAWNTAVQHIHAHLVVGNCYQVNLTRRLECDVAPDPVALYRSIQRGNPAPHAALLRVGDTAVVSASPERFLRRDGRRVETRPIKGTARDADTLASSVKDRAENVMIVDLARNDLGRVCEYGSIQVPRLFEIEEHPGLHHLVSTVVGTLRDDTTTADLVHATFPPASVTGCPKPRVMQIIEELEPVRRGVYCGAVGFIDAERDIVDLNVAIRTFTISGGITSFGVGGGIVADSDAGSEWKETELKARRLLQLAAG